MYLHVYERTNTGLYVNSMGWVSARYKRHVIKDIKVWFPVSTCPGCGVSWYTPRGKLDQMICMLKRAKQ